MLISYCVPVMNRTYDLKKTLPIVIDVAREIEPIEIVIVNYNSQDDLDEYIKTVNYDHLTYRKYTKNKYFHMAHSRNLTIRASSGDYIIISSADIIPMPGYFSMIKRYIDDGFVWMHHSDRFVGVLCCERNELIESGGFDERFEFYGKEDKDLVARLHRRAKRHKQIPDLLNLIPTPKNDKIKNYRPAFGSRNAMSRYAKNIWQENIDNYVLVVNEGKDWGKWE